MVVLATNSAHSRPFGGREQIVHELVVLGLLLITGAWGPRKAAEGCALWPSVPGLLRRITSAIEL
jgi:hypothetical protein